MIQDFDNSFDNKFYMTEACYDDYAICFCNNRILLSLTDGVIEYPTVSEVGGASVYLFELDGKRYFLSCAQAVDGYEYYDITLLRTAVPGYKAFAGISAYHLNNWYNDNKYCGRCGGVMQHSKTERAMQCECGNVVYPKICPAVIVAIISADRICLTKYNRENARWALVAGFNEFGETIEQTVHREVMEEVGLRVKNLKYYKSQPWGFTSSILYGFFCEVEGDDTINIDNYELKDGRWFTPDEIDFDNDGLSLTREMIDAFKHGKQKEM